MRVASARPALIARFRRRVPRYNEEDFPRTFRDADGQQSDAGRQEPTFTGPLYNYKDSKAFQREQEERTKKEKYPMPTFEKLIIDERERSRRQFKEKVKAWALFFAFLILCSLRLFR